MNIEVRNDFFVAWFCKSRLNELRFCQVINLRYEGVNDGECIH